MDWLHLQLRICTALPRSSTCAFLHAAYESRTVREFFMNVASMAGTAGSAAAGAGVAGNFADASWMASGLDAGQSIAEHAAAIDAVQELVIRRLELACPQLLTGGLLSPRSATFQLRFEVAINETLAGAFPCAMHFRGGLHQGVLHVTTRQICFEARLEAEAYMELPLTRIAGVKPCNDPLFHLIPNALHVAVDDGSHLVFASFNSNRDEAHALLARSLPGVAATDVRQP